MRMKFKNVKDERWLKRYLNFIHNFSLLTSYENTHIHHILPSSLYPEYKNLKEYYWNKSILTHRAHLIAHYMLAKALGGNMWFAYNNMNCHNVKLSSRLYEIGLKNLRTVLSILMKERIKKYGHNKGMLGKKHTKETKIKIGLSCFGNKHTEETKQNLKDNYFNKSNDEKELINKKISTAKTGFKHSEESKEKMSKSKKGTPNKHKGKTLEEIYGEEKGSLLREQNKRPSKHKGKTYEEIYGVEKAKELKEIRRSDASKISDETKKIRSETLKGKNKTEEHLNKIKEAKENTTILNKDGINKHIKNNLVDLFLADGWSIGILRKPEQKFICKICGIETNKGNLNRWHNDKCKNKN